MSRILLPIDAAIPCGLIVNELISNALKHAFPNDRAGNITVRLADTDGVVELSVRDDGVGVADPVDVAGTETLGLQLVTLLSEQLGGKLEINRKEPTHFQVLFPLARWSRRA